MFNKQKLAMLAHSAAALMNPDTSNFEDVYSNLRNTTYAFNINYKYPKAAFINEASALVY